MFSRHDSSVCTYTWSRPCNNNCRVLPRARPGCARASQFQVSDCSCTEYPLVIQVHLLLLLLLPL